MTIEERKNELEESFKRYMHDGNNLCTTVIDLQKSVVYPVVESKIYQNKVKKEFVGTHAEYLKALEIAKEKDNKNYKDMHHECWELANFIGKLFYNKLAEDNGYNADSKVWATIYSKAYEDSYFNGYKSIASKAYDLCDFLSSIESAKKEEM